jgi:hypothetical protein
MHGGGTIRFHLAIHNTYHSALLALADSQSVQPIVAGTTAYLQLRALPAGMRCVGLFCYECCSAKLLDR